MTEAWLFGLEFWATFCDMAPYLLFGFFVAGLLSAFISPAQVERHLGGHGVWPVLKAALFGVPLPLCSCSVLPVTASLRKHGAGRGPATAFLISTPQTGDDSILVTFGMLGPVFGIFRPVAAFVSGVLGGVAVDIFEPHGAKDTHVVEKCNSACCNGEAESRSKLSRIFSVGFVELPRDIGKPLLIGVVVAGAITAFIPEGLFRPVGFGIIQILVMMLIGIPMYVCATASIPVAAAAMMAGVSPGAALAFLITGPATNAAGIATVWKLMGARTTVIYLASVAVTAIGSGLLLDLLFKEMNISHAHAPHEMLPPVVKTLSGIALLLITGFAMLRHNHGKGEHHEHDEHCEHCRH